MAYFICLHSSKHLLLHIATCALTVTSCFFWHHLLRYYCKRVPSLYTPPDLPKGRLRGSLLTRRIRAQLALRTTQCLQCWRKRHFPLSQSMMTLRTCQIQLLFPLTTMVQTRTVPLQSLYNFYHKTPHLQQSHHGKEVWSRCFISQSIQSQP